LVSANQGGQGVHRERWCRFPEASYRFQRIGELLAQRERHEPLSLLRISYDTLDGCARRLLPLWAPLLPEHPLARRLVAWAETQTDRSLMSVFGTLYEETCFLLLEQDLERPVARRLREWSALAFFQEHVDRVLALECPELLGEAELRALLQRAFSVAMSEHDKHDVPVRLRFSHLVTRGRSPAWLGFDSPEIELPGNPGANFQCRLSPISGERLLYAPAFHLLMDMSRRGAWYNMPGGASESRFGPGYGKGVQAWLDGTLEPLGASPLEPLFSVYGGGACEGATRPVDAHQHAGRGGHGDAEIAVDALVGHELEAEPLEQEREHDFDFEQGERGADAHARTGAEWVVSVRPGVEARPTFGAERERVRVQLGHAVRVINAAQHLRAFWDLVLTQLGVACGDAVVERRGREQP
jgi:hypothetical protein